MQSGGFLQQSQNGAAVHRPGAGYRQGKGVRLPGEDETERIGAVPGNTQQQGEGKLQQPGLERSVYRFGGQPEGQRDIVKCKQHRGSLGYCTNKSRHILKEQGTVMAGKLQDAAYLERAHAGEHLPSALAFGVALLPQGGKMKKVIGQRLPALALRV